VITLVVNGLSNNDICQQLFITNATLRTHLNKVYSKVKDAGLAVEHLPNGRRSAGEN
jgi:ATP/maltotriose-dependent transcriptional regulator MalT